jgi:hypothetical protein
MGTSAETTTHYRVRFSFRHATRYHKAGEVRYVGVWHYNHDGERNKWILNVISPVFAAKFDTKKAAHEAAASFDREEYGGDRCCERLIERVTEMVQRAGKVPAPETRSLLRKQKLIPESCGDCRPRRGPTVRDQVLRRR